MQQSHAQVTMLLTLSIILHMSSVYGTCSQISLSLLCSKYYLLFFPEFPKIFTYYSFFILVSSLLFQTNSHLVSVASHDLTALLEYLSVLLEYIDLLKVFSKPIYKVVEIKFTIYHLFLRIAIFVFP